MLFNAVLHWITLTQLHLQMIVAAFRYIEQELYTRSLTHSHSDTHTHDLLRDRLRFIFTHLSWIFECGPCLVWFFSLKCRVVLFSAPCHSRLDIRIRFFNSRYYFNNFTQRPQVIVCSLSSYENSQKEKFHIKHKKTKITAEKLVSIERFNEKIVFYCQRVFRFCWCEQ